MGSGFVAGMYSGLVAPGVVADKKGGVADGPRSMLAACWAWATSSSCLTRSMGPAKACELGGSSIARRVEKGLAYCALQNWSRDNYCCCCEREEV